VKDAERIYALYVQANPVPDADLLSLTRDEAALLTIEGSQDMLTQEPVSTHTASPPTKRRAFAAAGAIAAVVAIGLVAALLLNSDDSQPVAAADATPEMTFDGTTCSYEGPALIEEGLVDFSLTNTAAEAVAIAGWLVEGSALEAQLQRAPIGTDWDTTGEPTVEGTLDFVGWVEPGESRTTGALLTLGTYLVDCVTGNPTDHVWRAAQFEVVAP
jgi:hypothetical protein